MAATDYYASADAGGGGTGLSWAQAWNLAELEADVEANAEAGDRYFIEGGVGTYTLTNDFLTALDGTEAAPISLIGVVSGTSAEPPTASDWATGTNRPLFSCGEWAFQFDDYWQFYNLRIETTDAVSWRSDTGSLFVNCKSDNSSGSSNRYGFALTAASSGSSLVDCEAISTNGRAFGVGSQIKVFNCWAHDSVNGIYSSSDISTFINNIISNCTEGFTLGDTDRSSFVHNTLYECDTGFTATTGALNIIMNNNIIGCDTAGATWTTEQKSNFVDYNNWYGGNSTTTTNLTKGSNTLNVDPAFESAVGDDFRLATGSACLNAGKPLMLGV